MCLKLISDPDDRHVRVSLVGIAAALQDAHTRLERALGPNITCVEYGCKPMTHCKKYEKRSFLLEPIVVPPPPRESAASSQNLEPEPTEGHTRRSGGAVIGKVSHTELQRTLHVVASHRKGNGAHVELLDDEGYVNHIVPHGTRMTVTGSVDD